MLLLVEVGKENFSASLCKLFSLARDCLLFNDPVTDVLQQQLEDVDSVLVVELGGELLCDRGDQWLEKKSLLVLIVSRGPCHSET